jgi:hypothetical protein
MLEIVVGAYTVSDLVDGMSWVRTAMESDSLLTKRSSGPSRARDAFLQSPGIMERSAGPIFPVLVQPNAECENCRCKEGHPTSFTFTEMWRVHRRLQESETPTGESLSADICLTCYSANWGGYYVLLFQVF